MTMAEPRPLRVPKNPLEVELALTGLSPRGVRLYLAEQGSHDFRRQGILDLLEQDDSFLPACDLESGEWESFSSRAVAWIGIPLDLFDGEVPATELFEHRRVVRVFLLGGTSLLGELLYSAPDESSRVVDLMNQKERFFRLWTEDRVFLVNKQSVQRVVEEKPGR
jgi:hypothetical protein